MILTVKSLAYKSLEFSVTELKECMRVGVEAVMKTPLASDERYAPKEETQVKVTETAIKCKS